VLYTQKSNKHPFQHVQKVALLHLMFKINCNLLICNLQTTFLTSSHKAFEDLLPRMRVHDPHTTVGDKRRLAEIQRNRETMPSCGAVSLHACAQQVRDSLFEYRTGCRADLLCFGARKFISPTNQHCQIRNRQRRSIKLSTVPKIAFECLAFFKIIWYGSTFCSSN